MGLVSKTLSGLYNGVSQQAPTLRLETQGERQINIDSSLTKGLSRRPPTRWVKNLTKTDVIDTNKSFTHFVDLGVDEQFMFLFHGDAPDRVYNPSEPKGVLVYDLEGNPYDIVDETGVTDSYFYKDDEGNPIDPKRDLKVVTVGDYTVVVNKKVKARMDVTSTTPANTEDGLDINRTALVYVRSGYPETKYVIKVTEGGTTYTGTYTTPAPSSSGVSYAKTDDIAESLKSNLASTLPADYTVSREGSVIIITLTDGASNFTLKTNDSYGDQALLGIKGVTQNLNDLPPTAPTGYRIKVEGDESTNYDNFYVKYVRDENLGSGIWEEDLALLDSDGYALVNSFDADTMPKKIVLNRDSNRFEVSNIEWSDREIGDDISNPYPSFIDKNINNVFFSKNRLGFLAGDSFIMSRSGDYFNFWSATATDVLDTDPIDNAVSTNQVIKLEAGVPFAGSLLTFSKKVQFMIHGGDSPLTPKTVIADPTTQFDINTDIQPVGVGSNIYFIVPSGNYSSIREYFVQKDMKMNDAIDITAHVPQYLPASVDKLIGSSAENMLIALDSSSNVMYIYRYFWNNNEKLQSAWYKWQLNDVNKIIDGYIIDSTLYLIVQRGSLECELLTIALEEGETGSLPFKVYLDRRVELQGVYNSDNNSTTFTLPYELSSENFMFINSSNGFPISAVYTQTSNNIITMQGDYSSDFYYVGLKFPSLYELSKFYTQDGNGNPIIQGRLQLRNMTVTYSDTGYFKVNIQRKGYRRTEENITNTVLGESILGENGLISGEQKVSILGRNSQVDITIESDSFLPFNIQTVSYEGIFTSKSYFTQ